LSTHKGYAAATSAAPPISPKPQEFFTLAKRFRNATDHKKAKPLGNKLGRIILSG